MQDEEKRKKGEEFIRKTHAAVEAGKEKLTPEQLNKKIKNTVSSWWKDESKGYQGFRDRGKTDPEFFAHNFARAGVGIKEGWEYTKETLRGYIDVESLEDGGEVWSDYEQEYIRTGFDQDFRDGFEAH